MKEMVKAVEQFFEPIIHNHIIDSDIRKVNLLSKESYEREQFVGIFREDNSLGFEITLSLNLYYDVDFLSRSQIQRNNLCVPNRSYYSVSSSYMRELYSNEFLFCYPDRPTYPDTLSTETSIDDLNDILFNTMILHGTSEEITSVNLAILYVLHKRFLPLLPSNCTLSVLILKLDEDITLIDAIKGLL